jgi:hypothetical protein
MEERIAQLEKRIQNLEYGLKCPEDSCIKLTIEQVRENRCPPRMCRICDRDREKDSDDVAVFRAINKELVPNPAQRTWTQYDDYNLKTQRLYWWKKSSKGHYKICENCHKFDASLKEPSKIRGHG